LNLSSQHSGTAPAMDPTTCISCHNGTLPNPAQVPQITHDIDWQAPPSNQDFRNLSDAQLCQKARNFGSIANSVPDHLKGDVLILWAVLGGQRPNGTPAEKALGPTSDLGDWNDAVDEWVSAERPCP
jgi:hypothetical protein